MQRPKSVALPSLTIPHLVVAKSSAQNHESSDDVPPVTAPSRSEAPAFRASRGERLLPKLRSVARWLSIAFGCVGLVLSARAFLLHLPTERGSIKAAPAMPVAPPAPPSVAPTEAAPAMPVAPPAPPSVVPTEAARPAPQGDDLVTLGNGLLKTGDIASARLYFERAAETGNAHAAYLVGRTYNAGFLSALGVRGMLGDPDTAVRWYQRARDLGDPDATRVLLGLSDAELSGAPPPGNP